MQEPLDPYWTLLRLKADGSYQPKTLTTAQDFITREFSHPIDPAQIPKQLLTHPAPAAQLCLRCYISHEIVQTCFSLVRQFGETYKFQLSDLLPFVLDDDGQLIDDLETSRYTPLAIDILERFSPESGSLRNWIIRLVRQHSALQQFLLEQGLHMITAWAILNDTAPESLANILREFYHYTPSEIDFAIILLNSYHAIYLADRQQQGGRKRCEDPTDLQLQRIAALIKQNSNRVFTPDKVFDRLQKLSDQLRQYRIYRRGGQVRQGDFSQSFDVPETSEQLEYQITQNQPEAEDDPDQVGDFLQAFRQEFTIALEQALSQVVQHRLQAKPKKAVKFLQALEQLHCQQRSMGDIAPAIGLKRQDDVSRLLQLKTFRGDVRNLVLHQIKTFMKEKGSYFIDPDRLVQVAHRVDAALESQIDDVIAAAQKEATTAKEYIQPSLFTQKLCTYLHQIMTVP
ncbi:MAG: hypothetical protein VKJ24_20575 [Synechococcales bacterium]|nr:hypothetical protein [Synechococcales bacterium]